MRRSLLLIAPLVALSACDPDYESTGWVRVVSNGGVERTWVVPDAENVGAGPARLGAVAGDVAQAWYAIGSERSAYLFDGSLATGIEGGAYLALPAYQPGSPSIVEDGGVSWMVVDSDRPDYQSLRVYDSGACSLTLNWGTALLPGLIPAFSESIASAVDAELARCGSPLSQRFSRTTSALVEPVYRARAGGGAGALGVDDDVIRYSARYTAPSIGGCAPVNLDIAFEVGFRQGPEGEILGYVNPESIYAEVADFCIAEGAIETSVQATLLSTLPGALAAGIHTGTRLSPTALGLPAGPACNVDADCAGAFPGTGHRCTDGVCELQLNVDRINVRPEGVELVLMETEDDPQRTLLNSDTFPGALIEGIACGPDRNNNMFVLASTPGTLVDYNVAVDLDAAAICS